MKTILILIFFFTTILSINVVKAQRGGNIDTTFEQLKRINYTLFEGSPIDTLLHHVPANYLSMDIVGHHKPNYGDEFFITYPNEVFLIIRINKFQYATPKLDFVNNPQAAWDLNLYKKERIFYSALWRGPICYAGCAKEEQYAH